MTTALDRIIARRGAAPGAPAPLQKVSEEERAQMVKAAEERAAAAVAQQFNDLGELFGSVLVASATQQLLRSKHSMANGLCWACGEREPNEFSTYRRCAVCDASRL